MDAHALVIALLEADEVDAKSLAMRTEEPYWEAAVAALRLWLDNLSNVDAAIRAAAHDRPSVRATATSQVLDHYINRIARQVTEQFTLDDDDESELRRMLMRAWQHERSGSKSSEIAMLKQRLGESDEIDPKKFVARMYTIDVGTLRDAIEAAVPGLKVPVIHSYRPTIKSGPEEDAHRQTIILYLAKEPVSNDGFDPRHSVVSNDQKAVQDVIYRWVEANHGHDTDIVHRTCQAVYKNVSRVCLIHVHFTTEQGTDIIGHQNLLPTSSVQQRYFLP